MNEMTFRPNIEAYHNDTAMNQFQKLAVCNFVALVAAASDKAEQVIMDKGDIAEMFQYTMKMSNSIIPEAEVQDMIMKATTLLSDVGIYEE